jgi:hypothetical protein
MFGRQTVFSTSGLNSECFAVMAEEIAYFLVNLRILPKLWSYAVRVPQGN